ncbi:tRNA uridine-5-carboxymethylaminomethyl(34) synthesis GTPase MnmE [Pseudomaricurvus sp. HS19]|uniref:tRNA uridine-5-carboxymethylaminomethyl(34) synthesis GTPase MnmE n=1 Tax=Pseudomaricurvus sp. HS19 TaxID=2692626 RepID=UPI00136D6838|nr:tRNA uridine-5-carboxymethylaminomethyl(34) synthesis GTPase MnmE [Pseudomaricurvus sp. HS19]MYM63783.1 tRNA uridine-5-carboxymethylaminomethyl(34) synthesis GTPase MnmE [Pseudomaricurvus sp. HS19]
MTAPTSAAFHADTIAAIATAPGKGGVGIIRVSGPAAAGIAREVTGRELQPRHAHYGPFNDAGGDAIDSGLALYFPGPHSFTGEDVLELQGHGGPVVLDWLLERVMQLGARLARPGEFSERAFLNDKLDLAQAEAIADLIDASSQQAARNALNSLQGVFSREVEQLVEGLIHLRMYVEAAIDFPEEEIDFLADGKVSGDLAALQRQLQRVQREARQGALIREGMQVVIAGRPNAGKSSLLNALSGRDSAIVTHIEGTTRDVLREHIHIDGMPLHIIDTAGLRDSPDEVEQIGIERAWAEIRRADRILMVVDATTTTATSAAEIWPEFVAELADTSHVTLVLNKCDLVGDSAGLKEGAEHPLVRLSAKSGDGVDQLREHLKACMGFTGTTEGGFTARRRHLEALARAEAFLQAGEVQLQTLGAGELLAEDLRQAQNALGEITGSFTPDELLGRIFSSFCIGK